MRIGCIILARYNSNRLPGKALMQVGAKPILLQIYQALETIFTKEKIVVATSDSDTDEPIVSFCNTHQINFFRGSLDNVAERFYLCAKYYQYDFAFRINGDNLFVATDCIQEMLKVVSQNPSYDFLSNVKNRTYPFGMSVELVKISFYAHCLQKFLNNSHYQEHVTLYLYEHENLGKRQYFYNQTVPEAEGAHLAIDTPEDLNLAKAIYSLMPEAGNTPELSELIHYYQQAKKVK
ncbi:hypothetical protein PZB74_21170 [Porifericola rhodea]|uniref:cytidylyltransferase domain-containing protein n=1 Tax=Porifericola rhodea TaxID=930972 RepID=UPI002665F479|nr:hypothetical protein [Porifericola rhodea]WKN31464.1 hypothetical protein PZB74_21170 [Porifericola rhodea]